ncbi:MAG: sensor histidine kinase [Lachnospiraceae bacterium]
MFRKLGRQLTLYNLLILMVVLAVVAAFAFVGSPRTNTGDVTEAMWDAALSGALPEDNRRNSRYDGQGKMALITTATDGSIMGFDNRLDVPAEDYAELASLVLQSDAPSGQVTLGRQGYVYLRFIESAESGTLIVLQETVGFGKAVLSFISRIAPMLIVSMVLVCIASLAITARALVPIRKSWERQIEFTADASHELRTPISVIQTNLEVVTDEPDQPVYEKEKWLGNIKAEADRMQKLVEDLLTLSRTDEGQQTLEKFLFNLTEALERTTEPLVPYAQVKGVQLHTKIVSGMSFFGDEERIKQLLVILTDNAIKHTPCGGEVSIRAEARNHTVCIEVIDTGEGMEKEHLTKIFDRFFRINKARERESGGSGLGLSIAKWIVDEHRGSINVTSKPGEGTTFAVTLPTKKEK